MSSVEKSVQKIFDKHGIDMSFICGMETTDFKAFLQPLRYKNKIYIDGNITELRYENTRRFLLISPVDVDISGADGHESYLSDGIHEYSINHSELVCMGKAPAYRWSIIHYVG
ncbi:MAG: hypothetical protein NC122_09040 [Faecalibacterium sp.]|nr:hypothetical protein [Ruminococcus sp.]MCM1392672.1 hypothetical protein [Ruminococcus sp.]MCM1486340.1 hypothetical protein [Faecalibacterium sp.]